MSFLSVTTLCVRGVQMKATLMEQLSQQSQSMVDVSVARAEMAKIVDRVSQENHELREALRKRESRIKQLVDYQVGFVPPLPAWDLHLVA